MLRFKLVSLTLIFTLLLVACSGTQADDTETLVLYSGRSESLVGPVIEQFSEATGIQVEVRYGSTSEMAATILEEGENSPADIFFAQDPGGLGAVADAGLLAPLPEDILNKVDGRFASPDGLWVGISGRARVVVYNTETLSPEDLPDTLEGFTDPQWRGRIGLPPTNGSFQTMVTGMRQVWGEEATRAWLEGILANEPVFYEKNTPTVAAVAAGEVEVGFVNHYYLYRFLAEEGEGFAARNYFLPSGGPGSLVMVAGAGRVASGQNEDNATRFLDFMLSTVAQQYFASTTYEYPLIEGVNVQSDLTPLAELNAIDISLGELADLQGTVVILQELGYLP
ncbi:MAG: iron ABC transporter substrate-binding protein [Chloroflexi bacterium]|nr:MAG: iron ABC transporter substrate-binding protein [Chloroflexota bacterium]MBL1197268.1 iron ABC transporter substrate-binding protein [Chloroflexota bacterium]NOH14562.1 iron ABC transporter substrate-binding protein [Chloroflexota bacterium]